MRRKVDSEGMMNKSYFKSESTFGSWFIIQGGVKNIQENKFFPI